MCPVACRPPPPTTVCDVLPCHVMSCAPTHLMHGTPIVWLLLLSVVYQESHLELFPLICCFFRVRGESSYDFVRVLFIYYFVIISIQHRIRTCVGNAANPPTFPQQPHTHTRTHIEREIYTHLPHTRLSAIHPSILYCTVLRNPLIQIRPTPHAPPTNPLPVPVSSDSHWAPVQPSNAVGTRPQLQRLMCVSSEANTKSDLRSEASG